MHTMSIMLHAILSPPESQVIAGHDWQWLHSNRSLRAGLHLQWKQSFQKVSAGKGRGIGHPSSILCVHIRNSILMVGLDDLEGFFQPRWCYNLAPNFTEERNQKPPLFILSSPFPTPPQLFFTLILLIHGPLLPAPCKVFLIQLHWCCPSSTPPHCKTKELLNRIFSLVN